MSIGLLIAGTTESFDGSLDFNSKSDIKCVSLNDQSCPARQCKF